MAATVDLTAKVAESYFGRCEYGKTIVPQDSPIAFGPAMIGTWNSLGTAPADDRTLNGRIDRFHDFR